MPRKPKEPVPSYPIEIVTDGVTHRGYYSFEDGIVTVLGASGRKSTQLGLLGHEKVEILAKRLLYELVSEERQRESKAPKGK
jgi:hypothetical protein